jgi:hypothetical protein
MNLGGTVPASQTAQYLRTLPAIRERCGRVHELAKNGKLQYFDYYPEKEIDVAKFCISLMKVSVLFNLDFIRGNRRGTLQRDYGDQFADVRHRKR